MYDILNFIPQIHHTDGSTSLRMRHHVVRMRKTRFQTGNGGSSGPLRPNMVEISSTNFR